MHESKEFKKGINQLEWELKEMFMKAEDLQTAALDLQLLRVTKDLQVYLSDTDQRQSKQQEIGTLEKTLEMYQQVTIVFHQMQTFFLTRKYMSQIEPFHPTDLFLYPLKISENIWFSDVSRGHRKRSVAWKELMEVLDWCTEYVQSYRLRQQNSRLRTTSSNFVLLNIVKLTSFCSGVFIIDFEHI